MAPPDDGRPGVSLSKLGLYAPGGLECSAGGLHHVQEGAVVMAAARGSGLATCLKCGDPVALEALPS